MLHEWDYKTIAAATGEEAIEKASAENWRFDAIVADHRLGPGLSGVAAAAEIARRANRPISTMIITGDTAKERIAEVHASVCRDNLDRKARQSGSESVIAMLLSCSA
jgi:CheY-like chemotaxis protein